MFEISPAIGCPIDCGICPQDKIKAAYRGPRLMSRQTFTTCIDKLPPGIAIAFAGFAEPYLNPLASEMVLYAARRGPVLLYTTCVGMTLTDVEAIGGVKFDILHLHLPDAGSVAKINITVEYLRVLDAMAEAFPGAKMMAMGKHHPTVDKYRGRIKDAYLHTRAGNVRGAVQLRRGGHLQCTQNVEQKDNILLPNGDVVLCCMDYGLRHVIGNLLASTYDELFQGEAYLAIRRGMRDGSDLLCRTCEFGVPA